MKHLYLLLAVVGALIPVGFFLQFFGADPTPGAAEFVAALFTNGATGGITADLLISSFVFWIYMWNRRPDGSNPLLFVILNLAIGLSCALPAYLYAASDR